MSTPASPTTTAETSIQCIVQRWSLRPSGNMARRGTSNVLLLKTLTVIGASNFWQKPISYLLGLEKSLFAK